MRTQVEDRGVACVVSVVGRITIDSSPELRSLLLAKLNAAGLDSLTIDLSDVMYIDTSAMAVLLETLRAARSLRKAFHLSGLGGRPRYLLEVTGFLSLFSEVSQGAPA
jgi:anti-sigma B factor antagonist